MSFRRAEGFRRGAGIWGRDMRPSATFREPLSGIMYQAPRFSQLVFTMRISTVDSPMSRV